MKKETYDKKLLELKKLYELEIKKLQREFAFSNCDIEIGSIIEDSVGFIQVDGIKWYIKIDGYPDTCFEGIELTKKKIPKKNGARRFVYPNRY